MVLIFHRICRTFGQQVNAAKSKVLVVKPGTTGDETTQEMATKPSIWIEAEGVTTFTIVKETPEDDLLSNANILRAEAAGSGEVLSTFLGLRKINDRAGDEQIEVVDKFCYLGSTEDEEADLDAEIEIRQHKMTVAFHMDKRKIYFRRSIPKKARIRFFLAKITAIAIYGCQV
jgi:hypothetical protein